MQDNSDELLTHEDWSPFHPHPAWKKKYHGLGCARRQDPAASACVAADAVTKCDSGSIFLAVEETVCVDALI
jgi:hypothetical protein